VTFSIKGSKEPKSNKIHKEAVVTNRFGRIVDLELLLYSSKKQGVWVAREGDPDDLRGVVMVERGR
jgi:hypothetical protein